MTPSDYQLLELYNRERSGEPLTLEERITFWGATLTIGVVGWAVLIWLLVG